MLLRIRECHELCAGLSRAALRMGLPRQERSLHLANGALLDEKYQLKILNFDRERRRDNYPPPSSRPRRPRSPNSPTSDFTDEIERLLKEAAQKGIAVMVVVFAEYQDSTNSIPTIRRGDRRTGCTSRLSIAITSTR